MFSFLVDELSTGLFGKQNRKYPATYFLLQAGAYRHHCFVVKKGNWHVKIALKQFIKSFHRHTVILIPLNIH